MGAPSASGAPSSGLLVTTVTQGAASFDPALGSLPAVDDTQRSEAWGQPAVASPEPVVLAESRTTGCGYSCTRQNTCSEPRAARQAAGRAGRRAQRAAAQARAQQPHHRRRPAHASGGEARRHREDAPLRPGPRRPLRVARRRLQRAEARVRLGRRGRGHRHRGARRDRIGHARRHPRHPRPRPPCRRDRHRRRGPRLSTRSPRSASRSTPPARTPPCSVVGTCRGTSM